MTTTELESSLARISSEARRLLWIITRGRDGVPEAFVEKVWIGRSLEDDKISSLGRMVAALERLSPEVQSAALDIPDEVRARWSAIDAREAPPPIASLVDELVAARLVSRELTPDETFDVRFSFGADVARGIEAWMRSHPGERGERDDAKIRAAYGERHGAAFVAAVSGMLPDVDAAQVVEMGIAAADDLLSAGATKNLSTILADAVRAASDASLVGPVVIHIERQGALDAVLEGFRASGDGLGEAGAFAALAGHHRAIGNVEAAIGFESRALEPLGNVVNSVIPRAIVHLRLSGDLLAAGHPAEAAAHHLAALVYRVLVHSEPRAELAELAARFRENPSYTLPLERLAEDPIFRAIRVFMQDRAVAVDRVQAEVQALAAKVRSKAAMT